MFKKFDLSVASFFLFALVCAPLSSIFATSLLLDSVSKLSSEAIWVGRVEVTELLPMKNENGFPVTQVVCDVQEIYKGAGDLHEKISFQIPGGQTGGKTKVLMGAPAFRRGGNYVIFLGFKSASEERLSELHKWSAFEVVSRSRVDGKNVPLSQKVVIRAGETPLLQKTNNEFMRLGGRSYDDFVGDIFR